MQVPCSFCCLKQKQKLFLVIGSINEYLMCSTKCTVTCQRRWFHFRDSFKISTWLLHFKQWIFNLLRYKNNIFEAQVLVLVIVEVLHYMHTILILYKRILFYNVASKFGTILTSKKAIKRCCKQFYIVIINHLNFVWKFVEIF